ncbi:alkylation response protein AidB-like acyl-CoA dehydrogenase [Thermosporothrix hazakensis]|uniref:Alkylation response protein AidB-like acyl-CoA dehydrogenase n=2 Tax=Thermosporothrix TaxID=768650 RepID=A0A326UKK1_THEHA|nr:acyl-CoA dehydrogenase family protein [Thermosporothrix hazakensis]PZW32923.1 alkylation response protein AidB-like acyl-CoA dehydrogenase [Thermosporothrix hazakensis]BBH90904.1 acyl-CoA dehydrogenase [Thermosporothrix sp. COM3]GCE48955.1 acyl-CoA dehydrogenase [Thermosporothrix hazakensis]
MTFPAYPKTEEQKKLLALAGELADTFAKRAAEKDWAGIFPYENYDDLRASGYLTMTVPKEYGGMGASLLDVSLAQQRLAQGDASTALAASMHLSNIAKMAENAAGTGHNAFFARVCQAVIEEGALLNAALSEPATGSPSRGGLPTTKAVRQPDGSWVVTGRKTFTTGSPALYFFLTSCAIEDTTDLPSLNAERGSFLIPRSAKGVSIKETWNSVGMRGSGSHDLILEEVHLEPEAYMENQLPSNPAAKHRLSAWSFPTAAVYLGIAEAARNEAVKFAQKRRPNSLKQPITTLPHIQEKMAKIELALLQSKAVFFGVAEQFTIDDTSVPASQFAAAKYLVTNHAVEIVDLAMRLVGGASLSLSFPLQRYYRDVRAGLHHPPMDDVTITMLANDAFATPEE